MLSVRSSGKKLFGDEKSNLGIVGKKCLMALLAEDVTLA